MTSDKKSRIHICPDIDIMDWIGGMFNPMTECKQMKLREETHLEMNKELKCHIYKGIQYCFCSLKTKV